MLPQNPDQALLDRIHQLGADFALEPFNSGELRLRTAMCLAAPRAATTEGSAPAGSGPQELLIAEDDPLVARFLVGNLEGAGFHTTLVGDGDAAIEALDRKPFAVVILDINMPKTDGFGVLSQLRLKSQRTPVLILSGRLQQHDIVKAFDLGADDYVTKPFNPLELVTRISRLARRQ